MQEEPTKYVTLGHVSKPHGIQGWVSIISYTQPIEGILQYQPWYLQLKNKWHLVKVKDSRINNKGLLVQFEGCEDRNQADSYHSALIAVPREELPVLANKDEYYWEDLIGLSVINTEGILLGKISNVFSTGSNDVLVVEGDRQRMLPYLPDEVIQEVNLVDKQMRVNWDADF